MVPAEDWPLPQSIQAPKSLAWAMGSSGMSSASGPAKAVASTALTSTPLAQNGGSATSAFPAVRAVAPAVLTIVTRTGYDRAAPYTWLPVTSKPPVRLAVIVPADVCPSPHSTVAAQSAVVP